MTMEKIRVSPARRAQIMQSACPRRRATIRTAGRIAAAVVLAVLLTFSAFAAAIPALREALQNALGSFTEQSQTITGIAAEGQWHRSAAGGGAVGQRYDLRICGDRGSNRRPVKRRL